MTYNRLSESLSALAGRVFTGSRLVALAVIVAFVSVAMQPAHAQSSDTWKSVAIIGGSTAAGAYIGHRIGGSTGMLIGAGVGASVGYAIDRRRRQNEYNNQYGYGYPPTGGYYGNGGYYGGPYAGPAPSGYQYRSNSYAENQHFSRRRQR